MRLRESVNGMRHGAIMGGEGDYLCGLIYIAIEGELAALPAEAEASEACRECDGTGAVTCTGPTGEFADQWQEPCPECSVDEKDELQLERKRHAEVIDDLQRKIRVMAKERERAEQAEKERDAARKALRGLVEATCDMRAKALRTFQPAPDMSGGEHWPLSWRHKVYAIDFALLAAKEVLQCP